jgi:hypothetical protein
MVSFSADTPQEAHTEGVQGVQQRSEQEKEESTRVQRTMLPDEQSIHQDHVQMHYSLRRYHGAWLLEGGR